MLANKHFWAILTLGLAGYLGVLGWHHLLDAGCSGRSLAHESGQPASHWAAMLHSPGSTPEQRELAIYGLACVRHHEETSLLEYLAPNLGHDPLCLLTPSHGMTAIEGFRSGYEAESSEVVRSTLLSYWWVLRDTRERRRIEERLRTWDHPEARDILAAFQDRMSRAR